MDWPAIFRNPPELETERLRLRPPRLDDADALFELSCDPAVTRYAIWDAHASPDETRQWIQKVLDAMAGGADTVWALEAKSDERPIGACGLRGLNETHLRVEAGFWLGRPYWGRGLMVEAFGAVLDAMFSRTPINRIYAHCNVRNAASARVLEKVGMRHEGVARQGCFLKGEWWDLNQYAILRSDWELRGKEDR